MSVHRFHMFTAACAAVGLATAAHAAVAVNFDGSTGLEQFNQTGTFTYQTGTTIIGTASIKPSSDGKATYNVSTFGLAVDQSITTTIKIAKTSPTSTAIPIVQLGFGDVGTDTFNNATTGYNTVYARALAITSGTGATYKLVSDNKLTTNTVASETTPSATTFTIDNPGGNPFYLFSVTLTRTGATTFTQAASLQLLNTDNVTPVSTIASYAPVAVTNAGLAVAADAGTMYAGFRGVVAAGTLRMDDYTVSDVATVPEPAALGLLGLAGLMIRRRR